MVLDSCYSLILGSDIDRVYDGLEVHVSHEKNVDTALVGDIATKSLRFEHISRTINSVLYFNLSSLENPIVEHNGLKYIYDSQNHRWVQEGYQNMHSYSELSNGGLTFTRVSKFASD